MNSFFNVAARADRNECWTPDEAPRGPALNRTHSPGLVLPVVAAILFLVSVAPSQGSIINTGVLSEESTTSPDNDGVFEYQATVSAPAPLGTFTYDFGTLGDTDWTVTWQAPVGKRIEVTSPTNMRDPYFIAFFGGGNTYSGAGNFN